MELISAVKTGDLESVKKLLKEEININQVNNSGASAAIIAAEKNHFEILKHLGDAGADLNITTKMGDGSTRAAEVGNIEMIEYLVNKGVHVGSLALIVAARSGNLDVTKLLVEAGANIDFQQRWGHTALMTAAKNGHLDVVKFLMERGTNLFLKDKNGDTAIIIATENDHAEIATMLKQAGAKYIAKPIKENKPQPAERLKLMKILN